MHCSQISRPRDAPIAIRTASSPCLATMSGAVCSMHDICPCRVKLPSARFDSVSSIRKICQLVRIDPSRCWAALILVGLTTMTLPLRTRSIHRTDM
jgi:hypothetical protein